MSKVYGYMCIGLCVSGAIAYAASTNLALMSAIFQTKLYWLVIAAPMLLVVVISSAFQKMSPRTALFAFIGFAAAMGLSLSSIFLIYRIDSIVSVFGVAASLFATMCAYGYLTKRDLTSFGSFLMMGVFGLLIALFVNVFMRNSLLDLALSAVGVIVFTGLTAYDAQKIRNVYYMGLDDQLVAKSAVFGALNLYINFINMFIAMLRLFGSRK
jgi:FtsH-binding integral membrane protein